MEAYIIEKRENGYVIREAIVRVRAFPPHPDYIVSNMAGLQMNDYYEQSRRFHSRMCQYGYLVYRTKEGAEAAVDWLNSLIVMRQLGDVSNDQYD